MVMMRCSCYSYYYLLVGFVIIFATTQKAKSETTKLATAALLLLFRNHQRGFPPAGVVVPPSCSSSSSATTTTTTTTRRRRISRDYYELQRRSGRGRRLWRLSSSDRGRGDCYNGCDGVVVVVRETRPIGLLKQQQSAGDDVDAGSHVDDAGRRSTLLSMSTTGILLGMGVTPIAPTNIVANALTPEQAERDYDRYAATYDVIDGGQLATKSSGSTISSKSSSAGGNSLPGFGIDDARYDLIHDNARGDVLEIGVGTGLNLDKYDFSRIKSLTLVDISTKMLEQTSQRIQTLKQEEQLIPDNLPTKLIQADATSSTDLLSKLGGRDAYDTVIDTFSLCVMGTDGAIQALEQMSSVVKPRTGEVLLLENSRSSNNLLGTYQDWTADATASLGGKGCVYNQNVDSMIRDNYDKLHLKIEKSNQYASGLFRSYICSKE